MAEKLCPKCGKNITNSRKKYCSDYCKYWYNQIKKDNERGLPPVKKRSENYFYKIVGSKWAKSERQGKRSGGMITGSMAARVEVTIEEIVPVTPENIREHFKGIWNYEPIYMKLGNQERVYKKDIFSKYGIEV